MSAMASNIADSFIGMTPEKEVPASIRDLLVTFGMHVAVMFMAASEKRMNV